MHPIEVILYVEDQDRATSFYRRVLGASPALDVPGMTEFDLGDLTLGLMLERDITALVPRFATPSPKIHSHPTRPIMRQAPMVPRLRDLLLTGAAMRREWTDRRPSDVMSVEIATIAKAMIG